MSPTPARTLTGLAALVVLGGAVYTSAIGEWGAAIACTAGGFGVVVAWIVVRHDPASPVGPALAWTTAGPALTVAHVGPLAALPWGTGIWPLNLVGVFALLLVFPTGLLRGWPWHTVPWLFGAATAGMVAAQWGGQQVGGEVVGGPNGVWALVAIIVSLLSVGMCLAVAVASLVVHYRRGDRRVREQIRWLLLAGIVVLVLLVAGWVMEASGASIEVAYTPLIVAIVAAIPAAVGIAIVRHDLFDIDRILSETAAWMVTSLVSAGLFGLIVFGIAQTMSRRTEAGAAVAVFVATLALLPIHRLLSRVVGRVVDRDRHVALRLVEEFGAAVRAGSSEPEQIEGVLREAQGDPDLRLLLRAPGRGWVALDGRTVAEQHGFRLVAGGDEIARIVLGWDSARARRRIAELAKVAWVPIEVSRLRLVLRDALDEARASRARLAVAAAEERKRVERDLHDGAQQRLIATGMRLRLLERALPATQAAEVGLAVDELRDTVDELRRIAQGIRPGRLDDGLAAALAAVRTATPLPVRLSVGELPVIDDTRSLTAYLVVTEAVANVLKHARATAIDVTVEPVGDRLAITVSDDGVGGMPADAPLRALRDRVVSIGGTLVVNSPAGVGTTIEAVL